MNENEVQFTIHEVIFETLISSSDISEYITVMKNGSDGM
jgi:hypothetical protein